MGAFVVHQIIAPINQYLIYYHHICNEIIFLNYLKFKMQLCGHLIISIDYNIDYNMFYL